MAAPSYKLTYFDIRGLAELPRLAFAAAGVAFTDERLPFSRNANGSFDRPGWDELKPSLPYGQVPILEVDGKVKLAQSSSILRFIAARHGLNGSNDIETALIDGFFEALLDIRKSYFTNKADAAKVEEFWTKGLPQSLAVLEKNIQGNKFFAATEKLSYADLALYYTLYMLGTENKDAVAAAKAPLAKVSAICASVEADAKVAAYLAARKETPM